MLLPLLMNLGMFTEGAVPPVVDQPELGAIGNWDAFRKKPKRKKGGTVIRRSDFESLEAYEAKLREAMIVPMAEIALEGNVVEEDEPEDDEIVLAALKVLIH